MIMCPVCGSGVWFKRYKINRWDIEECDTCGFARIDPLPAAETRAECYSKEKVIERNIKGKSFPQNFSRRLKRLFGALTRRDKNRIFYNKLCRYLPPEARILDVGCGDGAFLRIAKNNFICAGVEISGYLASLAEREDGIKAITGDFLRVDFADNKYDGITLISLLEHLDDPAQAVRKCYGLLNGGGILLMKTVNHGCINRMIKKENWTGFRPPDHLTYFNPVNLRMLLQNAGFEKIKISAAPFSDNMYCEAWK
jgi:2-polyprenyl-3-methyl-5-hydroxy-6-metoxy-1,4-benzoquinol methylase